MIPFALALSGCDKPLPAVALPPVELTQCAGEPEAPLLPAYDWASIEAAQAITRARDTMMLAYVLAFRSAWGDCKARVEGLAEWRRGMAD